MTTGRINQVASFQGVSRSPNLPVLTAANYPSPSPPEPARLAKEFKLSELRSYSARTFVRPADPLSSPRPRRGPLGSALRSGARHTGPHHRSHCPSPAQHSFVRAMPLIPISGPHKLGPRPGSQATPAHHVSVQASKAAVAPEFPRLRPQPPVSPGSCTDVWSSRFREPIAALRSHRPHHASPDCHSSVCVTARASPHRPTPTRGFGWDVSFRQATERASYAVNFRCDQPPIYTRRTTTAQYIVRACMLPLPSPNPLLHKTAPPTNNSSSLLIIARHRAVACSLHHAPPFIAAQRSAAQRSAAQRSVSYHVARYHAPGTRHPAPGTRHHSRCSPPGTTLHSRTI